MISRKSTMAGGCCLVCFLILLVLGNVARGTGVMSDVDEFIRGSGRMTFADSDRLRDVPLLVPYLVTSIEEEGPSERVVGRISFLLGTAAKTKGDRITATEKLLEMLEKHERADIVFGLGYSLNDSFPGRVGLPSLLQGRVLKVLEGGALDNRGRRRALHSIRALSLTGLSEAYRILANVRAVYKHRIKAAEGKPEDGGASQIQQEWWSQAVVMADEALDRLSEFERLGGIEAYYATPAAETLP